MKKIWIVICSSCMYGRIGQEATKKTPKMCRAYLAAAAMIRPAAHSLADAIKREDLAAVNRLRPQLKKMIDALVPALLATYDKKALEEMWEAVQGALKQQRDVDTPAFVRELQTCPKPVDVAFALRPTSMIPSQPLPPTTVLMVRGVQNKDLVLSTSKVLDSVNSKMAVLFAAAIGEGFGDVNTLPDHETPLTVLKQAKKWLQPRDCNSSLMCSRSGSAYAIDPRTKKILFKTERLDFGHERLDAAWIERCAVDVGTSGAYLDLCGLASAAGNALLEAAVEEDAARTAHVEDVACRLEEAYASGRCAEVVAFLGEARDAEAKGRGFTDRCALEKRLASIGVRCLSLNREGGFDLHASASEIDSCLRRALPPNLRVCRRRVVVIYPDRHVYPETSYNMPNNFAAYQAGRCLVFSETVADAALADPTLLDDLDSVRLDPYRAFVKIDEASLEKWRADHENGLAPKVMFNAAAGFVSTADVSREAAEERKAELDNVVAPGELKLVNRDYQTKEAFDYENYLKPGGAWDLARLEELQTDFETQLRNYQLLVDAKTKIPRGFLKWRGHAETSQSNLAKALGCNKVQGAVPKKMAEYARVLGEKIKELKASAAG